MSEDASDNTAPFDLERLQTLIEMMDKHGLTEVSLKRGDEKWRLRRGPQEIMQMMPSSPFPHPAAAPPPPPAGEPVTAGETKGGGTSDGLLEITSPTVGTFYLSPTPEDPPFVNVGAKVNSETIVCIVEAMKVFNQIPAEVSGTIVEVLANNGDSVEFGQPLFRVQPG